MGGYSKNKLGKPCTQKPLRKTLTKQRAYSYVDEHINIRVRADKYTSYAKLMSGIPRSIPCILHT